MPGDIRIRSPVGTKPGFTFFGMLSGKDIARLAAPTLLVFTLVAPVTTLGDVAALLFGLLFGGALIGIRPYDRHMDQHVLAFVRWLQSVRRVRDGAVWTCKRDYYVTEDRAVTAVIRVSPTNLAMHTQAEQSALHGVYHDLLKTITYPVTLQSRQRTLTLDEYLQHLREQTPQRERQHIRRVRRAYYAYCQGLNQQRLTATDHYIVLRVPPTLTSKLSRHLIPVKQRCYPVLNEYLPLSLSIPEDPPAIEDTQIPPAQTSELDRRCTEVLQAITRGDLQAERLTGDQLVQTARNCHRDVPTVDPVWVTKPKSETSEAETAAAEQDGEWRKTCYLTGSPARVALAWPLTAFQVDGLVDVTQVVKPTDSAKIVGKLTRRLEQLQAELTSQHDGGYAGTHTTEARTRDTNWVLDLLANGDDVACRYGVYLTAHDTDKDRCQDTLDAVRTRLQTMQFGVQLPVLRTDHAYKSQSLFHADHLDETQLVPAQTAAAGFPFATPETIQDSGIVYGEDAFDRTPIILDRFEWSSHSMARMGMVGSGKSYAAKLEILRSWLAYPDLRLYIVDPKQEYTGLVRALGGSVYTLGEDRLTVDDKVACFTVPKRGQQQNVDLLTQCIRTLYESSSQNRDRTMVVFDEARILMNDAEGRHVLNTFVLEGRDTNTAITLITQNASHFTYCREGREILDNMPGKVFMRHDRVDASVVDYFRLSERERQELFTLKTGTDHPVSEGVLKVADRVDTKVTIRPTTAEHAVITHSEQAGD